MKQRILLLAVCLGWLITPTTSARAVEELPLSELLKSVNRDLASAEIRTEKIGDLTGFADRACTSLVRASGARR